MELAVSGSQVSGRALVGAAVVVRALDPGAWRSALGRASAPFRQAIEGIDQRAWYPAEFLLELLGCASASCARQPSGLRELARKTLHSDAGSAMEPVVRVLSPTWASRHAQSVWRQYADFGSIEFVDGTMHSARLRVAVDPKLGGHETPLWCWLAGALEGVLQIAGAQEVVVEHLASEDVGVREYHLRWD